MDEADRAFQPVRDALFAPNAEPTSNTSIAHFTEFKLAFRQEDFQRAETHLLQSRTLREQAGQAYNQWFAATDHALGQLYLKMGRHEQAINLLQRSYEFYLDLFGPEHERVKRYRTDLEQAQDAKPPASPDDEPNAKS